MLETLRLIATDLDRTLLRSDKTLSDETISILKRCQKHGVKIVFATARSEAACTPVLRRFTPDVIISNAGALATRNGSIIYRAAISSKMTNALIAHCIDHDAVACITADTEAGYFVNHPVDPNDPAWAHYNAIPFDFTDQTIDTMTYKLCMEITDAVLADEIKNTFPHLLMTAFSGEDWYMFSNPNATKWHALEAVAKHLDVAISQIASFGDDFTDIGMITNSSVGVAVANAIDEVKVVADMICNSNDQDGVAEWIEYHILNKC